MPQEVGSLVSIGLPSVFFIATTFFFFILVRRFLAKTRTVGRYERLEVGFLGVFSVFLVAILTLALSNRMWGGLVAVESVRKADATFVKWNADGRSEFAGDLPERKCTARVTK
jgi:hypothetical protein